MSRAPTGRTAELDAALAWPSKDSDSSLLSSCQSSLGPRLIRSRLTSDEAKVCCGVWSNLFCSDGGVMASKLGVVMKSTSMACSCLVMVSSTPFMQGIEASHGRCCWSSRPARCPKLDLRLDDRLFLYKTVRARVICCLKGQSSNCAVAAGATVSPASSKTSQCRGRTADQLPLAQTDGRWDVLFIGIWIC